MAKKKDLSEYTSTAEATRSLEDIAADLRKRSGLVRFYLQFWFHEEPAVPEKADG